MKLLPFFSPIFFKVDALFFHTTTTTIHKPIFLQSRYMVVGRHQNASYLETTEFYKNKSVITISPGGYKGFYMMGIANYIREKYDIQNYIFSGASAGAWISLLMCYKGDPIDIKRCILSSKIDDSKSIGDVEKKMSESLLSNFKTEDFDLRRLFIGITTIYRFRVRTAIVSDFENLEDAIQWCMASSHIPFITGGITFLYKRLLSFDGGFSKYPYVNFKGLRPPVLHIHPGIWSLSPSSTSNIDDLTTLFSRDQYNLIELIEKGYNDAMIHSDELDKVMMDGINTE